MQVIIYQHFIIKKKSVAVNFIIHNTLFDYAYKLIF
jgi:hypothetical protein